MQVTLDSLLRDPQLALPPNWSECIVVLTGEQALDVPRINECLTRLNEHFKTLIDVNRQHVKFTITRP